MIVKSFSNSSNGLSLVNVARQVCVGVVVSLAAYIIYANPDRCKPLDKVENKASFRPPGKVFSIVWTILYATTGYAWVKSSINGKSLDFLFFALIGLLVAWLISFQCFETVASKSTSLAVILLSALLSVYLTKEASIAMAPISLWLAFASSLSIVELSLFINSRKS